jgi:hypothetical protein
MNISISNVSDWLLDNVKFEIVNKDLASIRARVNVDFVVFKIKGFTIRITEGKGAWVKPPVIPPKWHCVFYASDKEFYNKLCAKILESYSQKNLEDSIISIDK